MKYGPRSAVFVTFSVLALLATSGCDDDSLPTAPNQVPTASFTYAVSDLTVDFTDTSTDPDGTITAWLWEFGDGYASIEQHPQHTYATPGDYAVTLSVTDDSGEGSTAPAAETATASAPPPVEHDTVHQQLVAPEVTDLLPATDYTFTFDDVLAAAPFHEAVLFISETNADFNNPGENVAVYIDGVYFGGYEFETDNGDIRRTLMVSVQLSYTDIFYAASDGVIEVTLRTSDTAFQEVAGFPTSMYVWLDYEGLQPQP